LVHGQQGWLVVFIGLVLMHGLCYLVVKSLGKTSKFAELKKDPQLAAHFLPQLFAFAACVWLGAREWFFNMPPASSTTVASYIPAGERVACAMMGFQMYELLCCIPSPRLRGGSFEFVGHHTIVLLLSYLCYYHQAYLFFSPCFMGVAEISSLPLSFVDLFKHFKSLRDHFPIANEVVRVGFAVTFLACRGFYWPYCSIAFWKTCLGLISAGVQPLSQPIVATFLFCNIAMTGLQWFWASLILIALYRKAKGDPRAKEA